MIILLSKRQCIIRPRPITVLKGQQLVLNNVLKLTYRVICDYKSKFVHGVGLDLQWLGLQYGSVFVSGFLYGE